MRVHFLLFSFASSCLSEKGMLASVQHLKAGGSEHLRDVPRSPGRLGQALLSGVCFPLNYFTFLSGLYDLRNILFHHFYLKSGLNLQFETMDISMLNSQHATLICEP